MVRESKYVSKEKKNLVAWLKRKESESEVEVMVSSIKKVGVQPLTFQPWKSIAYDLAYISYVLGAKGCLAVYNKEAEGWGLLNAALHVRYCREKILGSFPKEEGLRPDINDLSLLASDGIALGNPHFIHLAMPRLLAAIDDPTLVKGALRPWKHDVFPNFLIRLYALYVRDQREFNSPNLGSLSDYQYVLDAWEDPDPAKMAAALNRICDYHVKRTGASAAVRQEFRYNPHADFPTEIIAIYRVREHLKLPTPEISHDLVSTPLFHPPVPLPPFQLDILDYVNDQYTQQFGEPLLPPPL